MRKGFICFLAMCCVLMTGCVSDAKYEELESRVENLERIHGIENDSSNEEEGSNVEDNAVPDYCGVTSITLWYEFDTEQKGGRGDYYQLRLDDDKCTLIYHNRETFEDTYTDYSVDTYNEVLNLVCSQPLEEYKNKADANGKIIYETIPCMLSLYWPGESKYYETPANMDEIKAKFEAMK